MVDPLASLSMVVELSCPPAYTREYNPILRWSRSAFNISKASPANNSVPSHFYKRSVTSYLKHSHKFYIVQLLRWNDAWFLLALQGLLDSLSA